MANKKIEKLIIIGSGPAGLTAAIYAARGNLNPLVIAGREAGGQLMWTTDVDDYPGFENGVLGPDLMAKMRKQAERFDTRFINEDVISVDLKKKPFVVQSESRQLTTESLIIATGASAMWLGLESEQRLRGRGVSACAVCDGFFFKDKKVIVVGGGDTAMREVNYLSRMCKQVSVVHRRDKLRAQPALQELVKSKKNVDFILNSQLEEVLGQEKVTGVKIKNTQTGKISQLEVDGVFIAIGHKPNTGFLKGELELDEKGYVLVEDEVYTKIPGVYVAGDLADHRYRQAVTAAGAGCKAALNVEEYLQKLELPSEGNGILQ
ncbi:thioredoxin-disulfide reductase [Candidatus Daviesbacteria bacterium RIFCSPHIGHO2_01_FULL_40_24]|uniref:Thioredoxin reductase n=1 Tax=Candidatus Daviesbacteria bacterium GW2011_GWC2_40_12 TaxID=1618431 RepID=A0A0G0T587_9BACT|nr:MAG: Thioredoxin-disulfide reductase [Candidatus Daviesbacteria bacterium GW2011_GWA2_39_33]KKR42285.1 MAG: Thioredoxin-disulfide reductase [Candidatus Daviesbacteria bacterium GW2011_GWC2_40_12]OGE22023.1 MAG: thioredoxin-disulfide reductase [Candidatus Daviesbacteria bacterium RIFCSPHIGHO2_01_FULL_40_24]OGE28688.1 MAG: thioredoxin-disulfide reductase [Candidatus Daviesbacteria bacterium RIFCSPHIGHO2_02_FULL_40_16]OGE42921.1 MAG: thioredoxin-disulfide reductase [Candidatus Daviesbacteria ba